jgi:tetratricopeptide (TPR) repeat protein
LPRPGPGAIALLLVAALFVVHAAALSFTQDDAYITLRYARNLVEGHGLVWNVGERVEGYSNFSWTLLLAALMRLGSPPVSTATWLGILFGTATVLWAAALARRLEGGWGIAPFAAAALVAGTSAFALWSAGGLETAMFAFLVTAGLERGLAPGVSERGRAAAPLLLALAALTRPEGPLVFALWFAIRAADTLWLGGPAAAPGGARTLVRDALLFVGPLVPYAAWKLWYYGDLLPNTYYAKAGVSTAYVARGAEYALDYFRAYAAWGVVPALALLALLRGGLRSVEARLFLVWCGYAAYIVGIGGDVLYAHRFWLPILPVGCVLVARGLTRLGEWFAARRGRGPRTAGAIAVGLALAAVAAGFWHNWGTVQDRRNRERGFVLNMQQTGEWLGANLPHDAKVAITTIGAIGYYSRLHIIDMLGLTDREIARTPELIDGLYDTWREIKYNAASVLRRRPDMILFSTGVRPSAAAEKALYLYKTFCESYGNYFFRSAPNRTHTQVAFRLRPDPPPFRDTRLDVDDFEFVEAYMEGHIVQSRNQDFLQAAKDFRRSWELSDREFPWAKEWLGVALYDAGDPEGLDILREVVREDSLSLVALTRIADHALQVGRFERAAELFDRIIAIDPDDAVPWMGRAEATRKMGDMRGAFRFALEGVRRWDVNPSYLLQLGSLAAALGDLDRAGQCYRRAAAIDPDDPDVRRALDILRALRERAETPGTAPPRPDGPSGRGG